jgi:hypothetical protein
LALRATLISRSSQLNYHEASTFERYQTLIYRGRPQGVDNLLDEELTFKNLDLGVDLFLTVETEYWIDISAGRNRWHKDIFPADLDEDLRGGLIRRFDHYRADSNCADGGKEKKQDLHLALENNV